MTDPSSARAFPERLGRYQLITPIASGGMATVYLARVTAIGGFSREVAVKLLDPRMVGSETGPPADELLDEARVAARIRHPAVVPVLDVGSSSAGPYLVMEYVEGDSLANILHATRVAGTRVPPAIGLRILSDALEGLHAAHEARGDRGEPLNVVHRDFSPQNILVGVDGATRLTDFGIARAVDRAEYTRTGIVRGKIGYMSPEQAQGLALDRASDVWSAGVVAWETFAGKRLFSGDPVPTLLRILNRPPPPLSSVLPEAPVELSEVIASALQHDLGSRLATAGELRRRLLGACVGWVEPASSEEVADFVQSVASATLRQLRERASGAQAPSAAADQGTARRRAPAARLLVWGATGGAIVGAALVFTLGQATRSVATPSAAPSAQGPRVAAPTNDHRTPPASPARPLSASATPKPSMAASVTAPARRVVRSSAPSSTPNQQKSNDLAPNPY